MQGFLLQAQRIGECVYGIGLGACPPLRLESKYEPDMDTKVNMNALAAITRFREAACAMPLVKTGWAETPTKLTAFQGAEKQVFLAHLKISVFRS